MFRFVKKKNEIEDAEFQEGKACLLLCCLLAGRRRKRSGPIFFCVEEKKNDSFHCFRFTRVYCRPTRTLHKRLKHVEYQVPVETILGGTYVITVPKDILAILAKRYIRQFTTQ